jgi:hypothetical protein
VFINIKRRKWEKNGIRKSFKSKIKKLDKKGKIKITGLLS